MSEGTRPRAAADYRIIPSIEQLRQRAELRTLEDRYGRQAIVEALREETDLLRRRLTEGGTESDAPLPSDSSDAAAQIESGVRQRLQRLFAGSLGRLINATGVVIHTNLGRAPLSRQAIARLTHVAAGYSNLEFDRTTGRRGSRDVHAAVLLSALTGAESAVVVNNNAAATLLILAALAAGREVVVSRGELVEIGGGFRVPDVMAQSGAVLREVGTTNKTRVADYEAALGERTALILRVHRSNFRIEGFTEQPSIDELVALGRRTGVPVVEDLGSGWIGGAAKGVEPAIEALRDEPTVTASVAAGFDLVCFSGDKLLGGPQAGLIVGRRALVDRVRRHPLMRALRVDKLTYAALEGTLVDYVAGRAAENVPAVRMLALTPGDIEARARDLMRKVGPAQNFDVELRDGESMAGGGSAPGLPIPTRLIALRPTGGDAATIEANLRLGEPPVVARVEQDSVLLDLRTVLPEEDERLVEALKTVGMRR